MIDDMGSLIAGIVIGLVIAAFVVVGWGIADLDRENNER